MNRIKQTLHRLFSERSAPSSAPWSPDEQAARQRALEIEIEARRGMRGF